MKAQRKAANGGLMTPTTFPLADFGYEVPNPAPATFIPANLSPIITASQLRELGQETIKEMQDRIDAELNNSGRHAAARVSYEEAWAKRYWRSQAGIERGRLDNGKARHRAHREPFPLQAPDGAE
ncbi:hypothetical protein SEA_PEGGYLEG03_41 [Arthrobacter phage PeggyLeg03]|nr:hypothetical protein SEA_PEGGYLEG03_41 [Arthrobacter phage PeggyLeg03]